MGTHEIEELEPLVLDLLDWIGDAPRDYDEVMNAWRTSCPRLPVWEEADERGWIERRLDDGRAVVVVTDAGHAQRLARRNPR